MKRIVGIILIFSIIFSVFSTGLVTSAYDGSDVLAYGYISMSDYEVQPNGEIDISVYVEPYSDIEVSCIQFYIEYNYQYGWSYPFTYVENSAVLPEEFSSATVAQSANNEPVKFLWESEESIVLEAGKTMCLGTFTVKVDGEAPEGGYDFWIYFEVFSYYSFEKGDFVDIMVYNPYSQESVWVGERFTIYNTLIRVPSGGSETYAYEIYTNKPVDPDSTYISDTDVAEIVEIVDFDSESSIIRIRGKELGGITSICVTSANTDLYEEVWGTIKVVEPKSVIISAVSKPEKMVFYIGEKCDKQALLEGLSVRVDYDNYEVETIDSIDDFTLGEYDFTTPGTHFVKVYCADSHISLKYTVKAVPEGISSDVYSSDSSCVYNVPEGTDVEAFLNNINVGDRLKIYDANGGEVTEGIIKTGMRAEFILEGEVKNTCDISVKYDLDGDGKAGIKDLVIAKKCALGESSLDGMYLKAAGGIINAQTLVSIRKYLLQ